MAKAPDPKQVAAMIAAEEAAKQAAEVRAARDTTARQVRQLRMVCGLGVDDLWRVIVDPLACPLDTLLAGWWLAGLQAGVEGEDYDDLLDRSFADSPWLYFPDEEEIATDGVGDDDPPA